MYIIRYYTYLQTHPNLQWKLPVTIASHGHRTSMTSPDAAQEASLISIFMGYPMNG